MAANYGGEIYRWTAEHGFTDLGFGDAYNASIGISSGGDFIVSARQGLDVNTSPARWSRANGWIDLGHPANGCPLSGTWGSAYGVSADGSAVVGLAWNCDVRAEAFAWTQGHMLDLGHPKGASSRASAISADASTIVGFYEDPQQGFRRAIRWREGKKDFIAGNHTPGEATAVTSDGSQIVGQASPPSAPFGAAFSYTDKFGPVSLGTISHISSDQSFANGVSDDGTVVGWSGDPFGSGIQAFICNSKPPTPRPRMVSLRNFLVTRGAVVPNGLTLTTAIAISADGSTVVGTWQDASFRQGGFIARLK